MKRILNLLAVIIIIITVSITVSVLFSLEDEEDFTIPEETKFIAHRGLSSEYYENTEQAFLGAAQSDFFFAIETDIWLTADNVFVCAHDENPFADQSKKISDISYAEAEKLLLNPETPEYDNISGSDAYICSFERYLEICIDYGKMPVIELKYVEKRSELENLIDYIEGYISLNRVMLISFHFENINNLQQINESLRATRLTANPLVAAALVRKGKDVGIKHTKFKNSLLQRAKQTDALINIWTVNDQSAIESFIRKEVDFITTDYIFSV